jgi:peptidyl-prolyl cis-trans isomerase C
LTAKLVIWNLFLIRLLKEPLLHFVLLGAGLFLLYDLQSYDSADQQDETNQIIFTTADINRISNAWQRRWQRPPTRQELHGQINAQIREEVLYREALAIGLDRKDSVVRRRMAQKMDFISNDLVSNSDPANKDLQAYLDTHIKNFILPGRISFTQIYLNRDKRGIQIQSDAAQLLKQLSQSPETIDSSSIGDPLMLSHRYRDTTDFDIRRLFGDTFTKHIFVLPVGKWLGPIESGYGIHLVRIDSRTPAKPPSLQQVRGKVLTEWQLEQKNRANETLYKEFSKHYKIVVQLDDFDMPGDSAE